MNKQEAFKYVGFKLEKGFCIKRLPGTAKEFYEFRDEWNRLNQFYEPTSHVLPSMFPAYPRDSSWISTRQYRKWIDNFSQEVFSSPYLTKIFGHDSEDYAEFLEMNFRSNGKLMQDKLEALVEMMMGDRSCPEAREFLSYFEDASISASAVETSNENS